VEKVVQDTGPVCNHCLKEKAVARVLELVTEEEAETLSSIPGEHTFKVGRDGTREVIFAKNT